MGNPTFSASTREYNYQFGVTSPPDMHLNIEGFVMFTEWKKILGPSFHTLKSEVSLIYPSTINVKIIADDYQTYSHLAGYVVILYDYPSKFKILHHNHLALYNLKHLEFLHSTPINTPQSFTRNIPVSRQYPRIPIAFAALTVYDYDVLTEFKLNHSFTTPTLTLNSSDYAFINPVHRTFSGTFINSYKYDYLVFCARKEECNLIAHDLFAFPNTTSSKKVTLTANYTGLTQYFLVLSDSSIYKDFVIQFNQTMRAFPRIKRVDKFISISKTEGETYITPFSLAATGNVTYHILIGKPASTLEWTLTAIRDVPLDELPMNQAYDIESGYGTFTYQGVTLPGIRGEYLTMIASKIFTHTFTTDFKCKVRVKFAGTIRGLFIQSENVLSGSSPSYTETINLTSSRYFILNKTDSIMVHIIGFQLMVNQFEFVECLNDLNQPITGNFQGYMIVGKELESFNIDYSVPSSPSGCNNPTNCLSCQYFDTCVKCSAGFLNIDWTCGANGTCPAGFYADTATKYCQPCHSTCATCYGPSSHNCSTCASGRYFLNNECVVCPGHGFYIDLGNKTQFFLNLIGQCKKCHSTCYSCTGPLDTQCTTCAVGRYFSGGKCIICSEGHYVFKGINSKS